MKPLHAGSTFCTIYGFLLYLIQIIGAQQLTGQETYIWETGSWGECRGSTCGSGGRQSRTVHCVHATERSTSAFSSCNRIAQPQDTQPCFKLCSQHSFLFQWVIGEWGQCETTTVGTISPSEHLKCDASSLGLRQRTVKCVEKTTNYIQRLDADSVSASICLRFWEEPTAVRQCFLPCSQDCIVTEFSDWSQCSQSCGNATQTRTRRVVLAPHDEGEECPHLSETKVCEDLPVCSGETFEHFLKVGAWSDCRATRFIGSGVNTASTIRPSVGRQERELECIRNDGVSVELSLCLNDVTDILPDTYRPCIVSRDCYESDWSAWSACPESCQLPYGALPQEDAASRRTRSIVAVPQGDGQLCGELVQERSCSESSSSSSYEDVTPVCQREVFDWFASSWSPCKPQKNTSILCGAGLQTRDVFCIKANDTGLRPVSSSMCDPSTRLNIHKACAIPCSVECQVSSWSSWGSCQASECQTRGIRKGKGYLTRSRAIILEPKNGAGICPHLHEFTPCSVASCYKWFVSPADSCRPINVQRQCGPGKVTQQILCLNNDEEIVNTTFCSALYNQPAWEADCYLPCSSDCVISEWGEWSECSMTCTGKFKGGRQMRRKIILAPSGSMGRACPTPAELVETRKCNDHSCAIFAWQPGPWSDCQLGGGRSCGPGRQTRNIVCDRVFPRKDAPIQRCQPKLKPPDYQPCEIECPIDCSVSNFSEWSACPSTCSVDEDLHAQLRNRYILQHTFHGGGACLSGMMEERVCPKEEACYSYNWVSGAWSNCMLSDRSETCGNGLHMRDLQCQRSDTHFVHLSFCFTYGPPVLPTTMPCRTACPDDCLFTPWGQWSPCQSDCNGQQVRRRQLQSSSQQLIHCSNSKVYPLTESRQCECASYRLKPVGQWSDCLVESTSVEHWCGKGKKFKPVQCVDHKNRVVSVDFCQFSGDFLQERCEIPCPCDCQMSEWSAWEECVIPDGVMTGTRTRARQLVVPLFGGRPCPQEAGTLQEVQSSPCEPTVPTETYQWSTGSWEECRIFSDIGMEEVCEEGEQWRNVSCLKRDKTGFFSFVNDSMCFEFEEPSSYRQCFKPCPGQLVYSEWSEWSKCPQNCSSAFHRSRQREVRRRQSEPNNGGSQGPSHLIESHPCHLGVNCFKYQWNATHWSSCILDGMVECGQGHQLRLLECLGSNGQIVDKSLCEEFATNEKPVLFIECFIDCPLDCHMSEWSAWSSCSETCGTDAIQTRSRQVLQFPNARGCPCPSSLEQSQPCQAVPCYDWRYSSWSTCSPNEGNCGMGVKRRNVTCHQPDGVLVDSKLCLLHGNSPYHSNINITTHGYEQLQENEVCEISCPGECERTDWVPWSVCHLRCIKGAPFGIHGFQIRSRASLSKRMDCPGDKWEKRQCKGDLCLDFAWQIGLWHSGKRDVWCQRTDGLNVTGGCLMKSKPRTEAVCDPKCTVEFSICSEDDTCSCVSGYTPRYSTENGELAECIDGSYISIVKPKVNDFSGIVPTKHPSNERSPNPAEVSNPLEELLPVIIGGAVGAVVILVIFIVCAVCCCSKKPTAKNDDKLPPPQYRDYSNNFWDDNAKMKYTGEIEL